MLNLDWHDIFALADRLGVSHETARKWRQRRIPPAWKAAILAVANDRRRTRIYRDAHLPRGAQETQP